MSLINDVKKEVNELDLSEKALKKGGGTLGITVIVIATILYYFTSYTLTGIYLNVVGTVFTFFSFLAPNAIKATYKVWMIFALTLGWFVSKIVFTIIFYAVITPIGFVAKLVGKEFLDINFTKKRESYWIKKSSSKPDYEKMH
jgi:polyferredoxin